MQKKIIGKAILAKLLEKGIEILVKKECKKIRKIEIEIHSSSIQIIKGIIKKIYIRAEGINYKDLLFDKIELEANDIKIIFNINNKELNFKNKFIIKFKISLSENSIKTILSSEDWNWIEKMITEELLNHHKLEDIIIKNDQILIKTSKDKINVNEGKKINIKEEQGKLYMENKSCNKSIKIPIEDKVCIRDLYIEDDLIHIFAISSVGF